MTKYGKKWQNYKEKSYKNKYLFELPQWSFKSKSWETQVQTLPGLVLRELEKMQAACNYILGGMYNTSTKMLVQ